MNFQFLNLKNPQKRIKKIIFKIEMSRGQIFSPGKVPGPSKKLKNVIPPLWFFHDS